MRYVLAAPVVLFMVLVLVGALTRRFRPKTCCPSDPALDTRMAGCLESTQAPPPSPGQDRAPSA